MTGAGCRNLLQFNIQEPVPMLTYKCFITIQTFNGMDSRLPASLPSTFALSYLIPRFPRIAVQANLAV